MASIRALLLLVMFALLAVSSTATAFMHVQPVGHFSVAGSCPPESTACVCTGGPGDDDPAPHTDYGKRQVVLPYPVGGYDYYVVCAGA
jgi:hypothetical protein